MRKRGLGSGKYRCEIRKPGIEYFEYLVLGSFVHLSESAVGACPVCNFGNSFDGAAAEAAMQVAAAATPRA